MLAILRFFVYGNDMTCSFQVASHEPTVSEQLSQLASLHDEVIKKISGRNDAIADRIDAWVSYSSF